MNLQRLYLTKNECYLSGKKHTVKGIMVHSTGANNPNLKRYVGPDDGKLGHNPNNNHWNNPRVEGGQQMCVHAFIGKLADGSVATYQTLPWDIVGWHSGSGSLGQAKNANNTGYIGFEICEDGRTDSVYFQTVYKEAVELCAYLCGLYSLSPSTAIICHSEGSHKGIASAHADVMHWFPQFGKSMDTFRADVAAAMKGSAVEDPDSLTAICGLPQATAKQLAAYLHSVNPAAPDYAAIYLEEGEKEGIRGDIAFAQSCLETGNWRFGGDVKAAQNNFCGLGAVGGGEPGCSFATPREGIRAQIQHLKAYANSDALALECVDPRFKYVVRGSAPYVEWLGIPDNPNGKGWAAAKGYGGKVLAILEQVMQMPADTGGADGEELAALREENGWLRSENARLMASLKAVADLVREYV